jgi:hypothetical protein
LKRIAELCPPVLEGMASPIAMAVHFTTVFLEYCSGPFDTFDLRDALKVAVTALGGPTVSELAGPMFGHAGRL